MNIFAVHEDPYIAASHLCDKHVVKMIVEGCQMLSTIHHMDIKFPKPSILYKPCFKNHPCTVWARKTINNYNWLAEHTLALSNEYTGRYSRIHKSNDLCHWFVHNIPTYIPDGTLTPFAMAMPDKYKCDDPILAYRNYYIHEKAKFASWKISVPDWYKEGIANVQLQVL